MSKNPDNDGMYDILIDRGSSYKPVNVKLVKAGKVSGMLEIRDKTIPKLRLENNTLAQKVATGAKLLAQASLRYQRIFRERRT